jgi:hypothetical protein
MRMRFMVEIIISKMKDFAPARRKTRQRRINREIGGTHQGRARLNAGKMTGKKAPGVLIHLPAAY